MNYLSIPNEYNGISCKAVVEVTRGTQVRCEVFNNAPFCFPCTKVHGIPFFANYGFIPSTLDGDGDCLDCYIIGQPLDVGWVGYVYPKLCIDYVDHDGQDYKIISVVDPNTTDAEINEVAEAICRAMGLEVIAIKDYEFTSRVITVCQVDNENK